MQILGLLGMYFNAAVVFVTSHSLLFRLALAILSSIKKQYKNHLQLQTETSLIVDLIQVDLFGI